MQISGEQKVAAHRSAVWAGITDPDVLARCIPGCEEMRETEPDTFEATVALKVGPVAARFRGTVSLVDKRPPESCRIVGSGSGGAAGFAKGSATVELADAGGATHLTYDVDVDTGGKIASLGARMMRRVAEQNVASFFSAFERELARGDDAAGPAPPVAPRKAPVGAGRTTPFALLDRLAWFGFGVGATLVSLLVTGLL